MKKPRLRRLLLVFLVLLVLLVAAVAAAPLAANLAPVRAFVARKISEALGRDVTLDGLAASWTAGVEVRSLTIANAGAEFGAERFLEARSVRVEKPLHRLILGGGDTDVVVDGLKVRIEEQGGGRTNLDDLVERLQPAPGAPPPPPREPTTLRLKLTDADIRLRRLPRRPQPREIDPFVEDPVVLPADEGLVDLAVARLDLDASLGPGATRLRFGGGFALNGREGEMEGDLTLEGETLRGSGRATGLDLALLAPFVGEDLAGRVDLRVEGALQGGAPDAKLDVTVHGLRARGFAEERLEVKASARKEGDAWRVGSLGIASASGAIALEGSGTLGDPAQFVLKGRLPLESEAGAGKLSFDVALDGRSLSGTAVVADLTLKDARLRGAAPETAEAAFDVTLDGKRLEIRRLEAQAPQLRVSAAGSAVLEEPWACDLTLDARADLARAYALARPFLPPREGARLAGAVELQDVAIRLDPGGNVALRGRGRVDDLVAAGFAPEEVRVKESAFDVDLALEEDGNLLVVRKGSVADLAFAGRVLGLREEAIRSMEGSVKGSLALSPLLPRLAGVTEIERLTGALTVDARASTGEDGISVEGAVTGRDLLFEGFGRLAQEPRVSLSVRASSRAGRWTGSGSLGTERVVADVTEFVLDGGRIEAKGRVETGDLAALPGLPPELRVDGAAGADFHVVRDGTALDVDADVRSAALTAKWKGDGVEGVETAARVQARARDDAWTFDGSTVRVGKLELLVRKGSLDAADVRVSGPLREVPALAQHELRGDLVLDAQVQRGERTLFDAKASVANFAALVGGERRTVRALRVEAKGAVSNPSVALTSFLLDADGVSVRGKGTVGDRAELELAIAGAMDDVSRYAPEVRGRGPVHLAANVSAPMPGRDGPLSAKGSFATELVEASGAELRAPEGEFDLAAAMRDGRLTDVSSVLRVKAAEVRRGDLRLTGLEVDQTGRGAGEGYAWRADVRAGTMQLGKLPGRGVRVAARGRLERWSAPVFDQSIAATLGFDSWEIAGVEMADGVADVALENRRLVFSNLKAKANEGVVGGLGWIDLGQTPETWQFTLSSKDVKIKEPMGNPLSFVLPMLRLEAKDRALTGVLDADLDLAGAGTADLDLRRSLTGKGAIAFRNVDMKGSILFGRISGIVRRVLGKEAYRFSDLNVAFDVREGRVRTKPFELQGNLFSVKCDGDVGLDGTVDFLFRLNFFPVPLRIKGTLDDPKVRPAPLAGLR